MKKGGLTQNQINTAFCIIKHESNYNILAHNKHDEDSRGLWQISKKFNPGVSDVCAYSLQCSTLWSINKIKQSGFSPWTTYKKFCK